DLGQDEVVGLGLEVLLRQIGDGAVHGGEVDLRVRREDQHGLVVLVGAGVVDDLGVVLGLGRARSGVFAPAAHQGEQGQGGGGSGGQNLFHVHGRAVPFFYHSKIKMRASAHRMGRGGPFYASCAAPSYSIRMAPPRNCDPRPKTRRYFPGNGRPTPIPLKKRLTGEFLGVKYSKSPRPFGQGPLSFTGGYEMI